MVVVVVIFISSLFGFEDDDEDRVLYIWIWYRASTTWRVGSDSILIFIVVSGG